MGAWRRTHTEELAEPTAQQAATPAPDLLQLQHAGNAALARLVSELRPEAADVLRGAARPAIAQSGARKLLRSVEIPGGKFVDDPYLAVKGEAGAVGAKMALRFQPSPFQLNKRLGPGFAEGRAELHLVQIVKEKRDPSATPAPAAAEGNVGFDERKVPTGQHAGWGVDVDWQAGGDEGYQKLASARADELEKTIKDLEGKQQRTQDEDARLKAFKKQRDIDKLKLNKMSGAWGRGTALTSLDPRYAQQRVSADIPLRTTDEQGSAGNAAVREAGAKGFTPQAASIRDAPSLPKGEPILGMEFEVAALVEYGPPNARRSSYLGSVRWGWERSSGKTDVKLIPLTLVSDGGVSAAFTAAAQHWNTLTPTDPANKAAGPQPVMQLPVA